jgi:hypothetical protein
MVIMVVVAEVNFMVGTKFRRLYTSLFVIASERWLSRRRVSPARHGPGRAIHRFATLDQRHRIET